MKLTGVEIYPANSSNSVALSFQDLSRQSQYNVREIVGLGADDIIPKYYKSSIANENFYALSLMSREIVLRIQLSPRYQLDETISDLRDQLYKIIASSRTGKIQLHFKNQEYSLAAISGFITKFETSHFEKNPEVQLTIKCDEPMLKSPTPVTVGVAGRNPADTSIEDPLSNAPHGFEFAMNITANLSDLSITDPSDSSWSFAITFAFLSGDVLHLCSEYNNKDLYVVRSGSNIYLADKVIYGSAWPIIFPGNNRFAFTHPANLVWNAISYYPTYWGV